jgi:hypothetical protein
MPTQIVPRTGRSFAASWALARSHGIKKDAWAESLGISRNYADDLTSGRKKPQLGEYAALGGGRRNLPWLIKYRLVGRDEYTGFYTGAGMSYDELLESGVIYQISEEAEEYPLAEITAIIHRSPKTEGVTVWSTSGKTRDIQRRKLHPFDEDEGYWP